MWKHVKDTKHPENYKTILFMHLCIYAPPRSHAISTYSSLERFLPKYTIISCYFQQKTSLSCSHFVPEEINSMFIFLYLAYCPWKQTCLLNSIGTFNIQKDRKCYLSHWAKPGWWCWCDCIWRERNLPNNLFL